MFKRLSYSLSRFMYGRYGTDQFNFFLLIFGLVISLVGQLCGVYWITLFSYIPYAYCIFRMLSRNIAARRKENSLYMKYWTPAKGFFTHSFFKLKNWLRFRRSAFSQRKEYKYFTCPKCGQYLRAPRGKGKIQITCRSCHTDFIKKT